MEAAVTALFDEATNTVSYIVADPATAKAAIVDCVLDFNPKSARTSTCSADRLIAKDYPETGFDLAAFFDCLFTTWATWATRWRDRLCGPVREHFCC
jgi:hypothetical protein